MNIEDLKIVKIEDKFAIQYTQKFLWFKEVSYMECNGNINNPYFYSEPRSVRKWCLFESKEKACKRLHDIIRDAILDMPIQPEEA